MQEELYQARSVVYGTLGLLFVYGAIRKSPQDLIKLLGAIESSDFDAEAVRAVRRLREAVEAEGGLDRLEEEFSDLFVLPFGGGVAGTASYYHDGREAGEPLVKVRQLLALAGLHKEAAVFSENEDHFGFVFTLMARLLREGLIKGGGSTVTIASDLYRSTIAPYAPAFAQALRRNPSAVLYADAAALLSRFLAFEEEFHTVFLPQRDETIRAAPKL